MIFFFKLIPFDPLFLILVQYFTTSNFLWLVWVCCCLWCQNPIMLRFFFYERKSHNTLYWNTTFLDLVNFFIQCQNCCGRIMVWVCCYIWNRVFFHNNLSYIWPILQKSQYSDPEHRINVPIDLGNAKFTCFQTSGSNLP